MTSPLDKIVMIDLTNAGAYWDVDVSTMPSWSAVAVGNGTWGSGVVEAVRANGGVEQPYSVAKQLSSSSSSIGDQDAEPLRILRFKVTTEGTGLGRVRVFAADESERSPNTAPVDGEIILSVDTSETVRLDLTNAGSSADVIIDSISAWEASANTSNWGSAVVEIQKTLGGVPVSYQTTKELSSSTQNNEAFDQGDVRGLRFVVTTADPAAGIGVIRVFGSTDIASSPDPSDAEWSVTPIKTSSYTAFWGELVRTDATGGAIAITLPTAIGNAGKHILVKEAGNSSVSVTVDANGSETIDGSSTATIGMARAAFLFISDGTNIMIA